MPFLDFFVNKRRNDWVFLLKSTSKILTLFTNIPRERLFIVMSSTRNYPVLNCQTRKRNADITVEGELNIVKI